MRIRPLTVCNAVLALLVASTAASCGSRSQPRNKVAAPSVAVMVTAPAVSPAASTGGAAPAACPRDLPGRCIEDGLEPPRCDTPPSWWHRSRVDGPGRGTVTRTSTSTSTLPAEPPTAINVCSPIVQVGAAVAASQPSSSATSVAAAAGGSHGDDDGVTEMEFKIKELVEAKLKTRNVYVLGVLLALFAGALFAHMRSKKDEKKGGPAGEKAARPWVTPLIVGATIVLVILIAAWHSATIAPYAPTATEIRAVVDERVAAALAARPGGAASMPVDASASEQLAGVRIQLDRLDARLAALAASARACCAARSAPERCPGWLAALLTGLVALLVGVAVGAGIARMRPGGARQREVPVWNVPIDAVYDFEDLLAPLRRQVGDWRDARKMFGSDGPWPEIRVDAFLAACRSLRGAIEASAESPVAESLDERSPRVLRSGTPIDALESIVHVLTRLERLLSSRLRRPLHALWRLEMVTALARARLLLLANSEAAGDNAAPTIS